MQKSELNAARVTTQEPVISRSNDNSKDKTAELKTIHVTYPEPHIGRMKELLKAHPEVKTLFGPNPWSAVFITGVVLTQVALAYFCRDLGFWPILALSWLVGAVLNHSMFVMIHDATHNLVFRGSTANKFWGIISNLPIVFPGAIGFRRFHLLHHRYQGEFDNDADLAGPTEMKVVGNSWWRKILWLVGFFFIEGIVRPIRLKHISFMKDPWIFYNIFACAAFVFAIVYFSGWNSLLYLFLSAMFAVGLHPLGARWIQEHYIVSPDNQETYSYYGPFNKVMFNVGYHNEHHDLMMVSWNNLPKLKAMAPEFYDNLVSHTSYWKLMGKFLFDPSLNLSSRVTRDSVKRG